MEFKTNLFVPLANRFLLVLLSKFRYLPIFKALYLTAQSNISMFFFFDELINPNLPYMKPLPCFTAAIVVGVAFIKDFASTLDPINKSDKRIKLSVCILFPAFCACRQVAACGWSAQSLRCTGRSTPPSTLSPTAPTCSSSGS